ncbi:MAG: T9SS type A sorting domain-containing protein [Candidatus Latescibacteria bacterium]|nr:T9SS type A sorting domain-containing protein [Candidatus Latescibacterota bacterium]
MKRLLRAADPWTLILALLLIPALSWAEAPTAKVILEPMWPQKMKDLKLPGPDTTSVATGLSVVGAGTKVYLRAGGADPEGGKITGATWALGAIPGGSTATLTAGPTADLYTLTTDKVGDYTVNLTVKDDQGETSAPVSQVITAANYVGVGTVPGYITPDLSKGQCAGCHNGTVQPDVVSGWLQTGHASKFIRDIDGITGAKYRVSCLRCHTVGWNTQAADGGFDEAMAAKSWTIPDSMKAGNWAAVPTELKQLANIQCENCHGPGGSHFGNAAKTAVSFEAGVCAQCHGSEPYHLITSQWQDTRHALAIPSASGSGRESCVKCHTARGYVEYIKAGAPGLTFLGTDTEFAPITCQACHDPHSVKNERQLRRVEDVTLENGEVISEGGKGKLCMTCHHSRRNAVEYVKKYSSRFGPHGNPQADMIAGKNAITYGQDLPSSNHLYAAEDACVTCHMGPTPAAGEPGRNKVGEHSYRMKWDNGTPDNLADDVENVAVCANCHGPMENFDKAANADYDANGEVEGVQTEVKGLLSLLARALPPVGKEQVAVDSTSTPQQLQAAYNYAYVTNDGSYGIHNTRYAVGILRASIKDLTGEDVPTAVEAAGSRPAAFALGQNYPNPFNPETEIRYSVATAAEVRLEIYNALGQQIRSLVAAQHRPGEYTVTWNGADDQGKRLTGGVYFYTLKTGSFSQTRKMVLLP